MYLIKDMTESTLKQIGEIMGGKDHTTVMYAINKIEEAMKTDDKLMSITDSIKKSLAV